MSTHIKFEPQARFSGNLLADLPLAGHSEEGFETILIQEGVRIERIISTGQVSYDGFWYDQPWPEWVLLVQGSAKIKFDDEANARALSPGDYLYIAPHHRHRVEFTQDSPATVWLAIHITGTTLG